MGQLAARLRQAALESARPSLEQAGLRRVATLVARGATARADIEGRLVAFTELVAIAVANAESQAAQTASPARIVTTVDTTRPQIRRDLRDGARPTTRSPRR